MTRRLVRALQRSAAEHGVSATLESLSATAWESATFSGFVHRIRVMSTDSRAFEAWLEALGEADLQMPGQIAADVTIIERTNETATIEVLTISE